MWTRVPLAKGLRFGPYEGVKVESSNSNGYCWQVRSHSLTFSYKNLDYCVIFKMFQYNVQNFSFVISEVPTRVVMKIQVLWNVTLCHRMSSPNILKDCSAFIFKVNQSTFP